ncbi:MAG: glycoside hydrolase family 78 protein [Candidatus Omnitrophica bacterium]|nr:glycoside hydrolase family 78 protein [Candidatus Omnitrophota bacterium]
MKVLTKLPVLNRVTPLFFALAVLIGWFRGGPAALLAGANASPGPSTAPGAASASMSIEDLRCEYLRDPLGIDVVRPRLSWVLASPQRGQGQSAYEVLVASSTQELEAGQGDLWDSGKVESGESVNVAFEGHELTSGLRAFWKVRAWDRDGRVTPWSKPAMWSMGLLRHENWRARWIAGTAETGETKGGSIVLPLFRKEFQVQGKVTSATLYITSLGYHDVYINNHRIGDHVLDPVQSDYAKRVYYVTHDVTRQIRPGENVIAAALGKGWYWGGVHGVTQGKPALLAQLVITYDQGPETCVATDDSWKTSLGPITIIGGTHLYADFGHEQIDGRKEQPGWRRTGFDDSSWQPAVEVEIPPLIRSAQMIPPNRITADFKPVSLVEWEPREYLFDLGENLTGWFRLKVHGQPGQAIDFTYYAAHLGARNPLTENFNQADRYLCGGGDGETFCSRFNYRAFRYVKVSGLSAPPRLEDAMAYLIQTDTPSASTFQCSDAMLNRLYQVVLHTHRCLTLGGIQVDCPHRERLGYGAEGQASMAQALCNFDMAAFYTKWSRDFQDGQDPATGQVYYTAPFRIHSGGGPAWSGASVVFPWNTYLYYGDRRILRQHYDSMCHWIDFLETKSRDGLLQYFTIPPNLGNSEWNFLGDWASPRRKQDTLPASGHWPDARENLLFNNCNYYLNLTILARAAVALEKPSDAELWSAKARALKQAINQKFFDARTGRYTTGEQQQAYLAFPLLLDLVPGDSHAKVMRNLAEDIQVTRKGHLDTGVLGSYYMLGALLKEGRSDLIYQMVAQKTWPGWGNMMAEGATTLWEHWLPGDSSIHNSFLSIGSWFVTGLGGINVDDSAPGFKHFIIRPAVVGGMQWVKATYHSIRGPITSNWSIKNGTFNLELDIPPGSTATVYVPSSSSAGLTESGEPFERAAGVKPLGTENGTIILGVASGRYRFCAPCGG